MQDYVTITPATISLTLSVQNGGEERLLQDTMCILSGTSNLRCEANSSSRAVVCTVAPGRHGGSLRGLLVIIIAIIVRRSNVGEQRA